MNKQKIFEDTKTIMACSLIGVITFGFSESLLKAFFVGLFVLLFYFSYGEVFILKNQKEEKFTGKITTIIGFSIGLLGIAYLMAWIITDLANGKLLF